MATEVERSALTAGELKKLLADVPDEATVYFHHWNFYKPDFVPGPAQFEQTDEHLSYYHYVWVFYRQEDNKFLVVTHEP